MKDRIKDCLSVLFVAALWVAFVLIAMCSCNSTKHLQTSSVLQDSSVKIGKDCTLVSSSRDQSREDNEKITRLLFGLQESIDAKGNPVTNLYPKEYITIDRGSKEKSSEKRDSIRYIDTSATKVQKLEEELNLQKSTQVFPMWWLVAIGAAGLVLGGLTRYFKIQIRK